MDVNDGDFSLLLKIIGFSILVGIICYNWGHDTAKPQIVEKDGWKARAFTGWGLGSFVIKKYTDHTSSIAAFATEDCPGENL